MSKTVWKRRVRLWLFLPLLLACGGGSEEPSESRAFIDWAKGRAIAFETLDSPLRGPGRDGIRDLIGPSRLVGIGESRHDTREQLLLKGLLVRHLVEDLGFRVLILEESAAHANLLDHYVTTGEGDLREVMNRMAGWYLWDTEEMSGLVQWVREFNQDRSPGQQIRVFGVDITAPAMGVLEALDVLADAGVETDLDAGALGLDLHQGDYWPTTWRRYSEISDERRRELAENFDELTVLVSAERSKIVETFSEQTYEWALWMSEIGRRGNALFSSGSREEGGAIRELGMADATLRILDREMAGGKAILWAHNLHVAKSSFRMPGLAEGELVPMGVQLSEELGEDYLAIGGAFGTGAYPPDLPPGERLFETAPESFMDGALAEVGLPIFLIDLREADQNAAVKEWLHQDREWIAQDSNAVLVPGAAFDLVYFVSEISRSQPTAMALDRYLSIGRQSE